MGRVGSAIVAGLATFLVALAAWAAVAPPCDDVPLGEEAVPVHDSRLPAHVRPALQKCVASVPGTSVVEPRLDVNAMVVGDLG